MTELRGQYIETLQDSEAPPPIIDTMLNQDLANDRSMCIDAVCNLQPYMQGLLHGQTDKWERQKTALWYANHYRDELNIDPELLSYDQNSTLIMSRLYFSAVGAHANLGMFIQTGRWLGRKAPEVELAKIEYLRSKKVFQDDVDSFFEHFNRESSAAAHETLMDLVNMARLVVSQREYVDAASDTDTHVFIGSILAEHIVRDSVKRSGHPGARLGDENEDRSPTKADVVIPRESDDLHLQVKMKWKKPKRFKVQEKKKPMHVIVPMPRLRSNLSKRERKLLDASIRQRLYEIEQTALQTGVDEVELAA